MLLLALDGNSIVNRAFYGVRPLTTRDGLYTNAIYGFLNILQKLLDETKPEALCVTFDKKAPTFRHLAYADYKGTRKPMPEELAMQMPVLREVLTAMRIPYYELDGWEADDLLGTISRRCEAVGWDCAIATGDKDSLQLITDHTTIKLVTSRMGQTSWKDMTPETFREQYGFAPIHMIDLKGLMGDTSDNIPGVKGVGEKTAMNLVQTYGSIEKLYEDFDSAPIKGALRTKLDTGREQAKMSYDLATIHCDAPIEFKPEDALRQDVDREALYSLFLKLEFTKLIERYQLSEPTPKPASFQRMVTEELVTEESRAGELLEQFRAAPYAAVLLLPELNGIAVQTEAVQAVVLEHGYQGSFSKLLRQLFDGSIRIVTHRVKETTHTLLAAGYPAEGFVFDTAIAAYLLAPTDASFDLPKAGYDLF